jgi:2C-methyl-D-erythritol 2,4-cyclodiphosphate synthase
MFRFNTELSQADVVRLREVSQLVQEAGYGIVNIDATIISQAPRMAPHIPAMITTSPPSRWCC